MALCCQNGECNVTRKNYNITMGHCYVTIRHYVVTFGIVLSKLQVNCDHQNATRLYCCHNQELWYLNYVTMEHYNVKMEILRITA